MNELLKAALSYISRGWKVIPIHTMAGQICSCGKASCNSPGKHPRIDKWRNGATTDKAVIARWWKSWPDANVGLVTGPDSGFWVLDLDLDKGGRESAEKLREQYGPFPETVEALTGGGGRHLLFKYPNKGAVVTNTANLGGWKGIDVRGEGGYIVASPSLHKSGRCYSWAPAGDPADGLALAEAPPWLYNLLRGNKPQKTSPAKPGDTFSVISEGSRNDTLTKIGGAMRRQGLSFEAILAALKVQNDQKCNPPLTESEVETIAKSVARYTPAPPRILSKRQPPPVTGEQEGMPTGEPPLGDEAPLEAYEKAKRFHLTDTGNAERLVNLYREDIRWCYRRKQWLIWNGKRWEWDYGDHIIWFTKDVVSQMYVEASQSEDPALAHELGKHATKTESAERRAAMARMAQAELSMWVQIDDLDRNPWLLNCENGTINLRNGHLQPHERKDLCTLLSPVKYDPKAEAPLWKEYLHLVTDGDTGLQTYLQRTAGMTLTGDTSEQCFLFLYGHGENGKSTFVNAIMGVLGEYAIAGAADMILEKDTKANNSHTEYLANLPGKRMVVTVEPPQRRRMAVETVKQLTGGDTMTVRHIHEREFSFKPLCKLWIAGNNKPVINENSHAIWRRMKEVPFLHKIAKRDKNFGDKLEKEFPGILAWAVQGCLDWQREGLAEPLSVQRATMAYRQEMDVLGDFIAAKCIMGASAKVSKTDLYEAYDAWSKETKEYAVGKLIFRDRLIERGIKDGAREHGGIRTWLGIRLRSPEEEPMTEEPNLFTMLKEAKIPESEAKAVTSGDVVTANPHCSFPNNQHTELTENNVTLSPLVTKTTPSPTRPDDYLTQKIGMSRSEAVAVWQEAGAPLIYLSDMVQCPDLDELLGLPLSDERYQTVRAWLEKHRSGGP